MSYPFQLTTRNIKINKIILMFSFVVLLIYGTWTHWLIAFGIYVFKGLLGTAVVHRALSHRAFKMHKWVEYSLASISLAGTNATVLSWVAVHRQHHRFSDKEGDPHSPILMPYLDVQLTNLKASPDLFYASDLLRQKFYIFLHRWHYLISIIVAAILFSIDPFLTIYAWLVPNFIQSHAGATVNSLNHVNFGYRNFDTKDNSHNNWITGIICLGEGWHNNHHQDPANPNFGVKWWEFDLGFQFSKLIRKKTA